jgi:hypothetical protein
MSRHYDYSYWVEMGQRPGEKVQRGRRVVVPTVLVQKPASERTAQDLKNLARAEAKRERRRAKAHR